MMKTQIKELAANKKFLIKSLQFKDARIADLEASKIKI